MDTIILILIILNVVLAGLIGVYLLLRSIAKFLQEEEEFVGSMR